jgi:hypothetical protein
MATNNTSPGASSGSGTQTQTEPAPRTLRLTLRLRSQESQVASGGGGGGDPQPPHTTTENPDIDPREAVRAAWLKKYPGGNVNAPAPWDSVDAKSYTNPDAIAASGVASAEREARLRRFTAARAALMQKSPELLSGKETFLAMQQRRDALLQARVNMDAHQGLLLQNYKALVERQGPTYAQAVSSMQAQQGTLAAKLTTLIRQHNDFLTAAAALSKHGPSVLSGADAHDAYVQKQQNFATAQAAMGKFDPVNAGAGTKVLQQQYAEKQQNFGNAQAGLKGFDFTVGAKEAKAMLDRQQQAQQNFAQAKLGMKNFDFAAGAKEAKAMLQQQLQQGQNFANAKAAIGKFDPAAAAKNAEALRLSYQDKQNTFGAVGKLFGMKAPLPLQMGPVVVPKAPAKLMGVKLDAKRQGHIIQGDKTGGGHAGYLAPLKGKTPADVLAIKGGAHPTTHFPQAWTDEDIADAVVEAAELTYAAAVQQPNGNWAHPFIKIVRRGIPVQIKAITKMVKAQPVIWTAFTK